MKNALEHLPNQKQQELKLLADLLSGFKNVQMVILFGSYATGKWVEDQYVEKGITYEYRSDYDLLVVLTQENFKEQFRMEDTVKEKLIATGQVKTPVSMIFHGIKHLNKALSYGSYFFSDIRKEGISLYDSEKFHLANPKKLSPAEHQQKAQDHFDQWFESAKNFYFLFQQAFDKEIFNEAAFQLHQVTERLYTAILLVFTDYRPKDHNLETLGIKAEMCDKRFKRVFPKENEEEKRLFELLKKAYIDARYKMDEYRILKEELSCLAERVNELKILADEICHEKIVQLGENNSI